MARVPGVPVREAGLLGRLAYRIARYRYGAVPEPVTVMLQRHHGLDIERLRELDSYQTSPAFTPMERRALAYADAMTALPTAVTDEMVAELDTEFGHDGLVELTYAIAVENHRARFNHALGITDQGFTSGQACRVPPQL
ncbi:MAG: carboxymuconolactone decarboxylase family protein [Pseudonocardiaceae bacterium]